MSAPAIRLRTLVRSRTTALIAIVSINLLGISAPITAHAVALPSCSLTQGPPCLFGAGNFEVDGDTAVNNGGHDWADVTHTTACDLGTALNQPSATDDAFTQGSSENDTNPTIGTPGIPPSKDNLTSAQVATQVIGGQAYLYLNWFRTNTLGTATIDYEFNQSKLLDPNGVTHQRTQNDLLITYDYQGGNAAAISFRLWNGTATSGSWSDPINLTPLQAAGTINLTQTVTDPCTGQDFGPLQFGEVAINLTALFSALGDSCDFFGSVLVKSRASTSFSSELKDFIAPTPVAISNCASPAIGTTPSAGGTIGTIIHDVATVSGGNSPTGDVTFKLYAPGDTTCGSVIQTFANEPLSGLTATSGNYTTTAVGTYRWTATYNGDAHNLTATSGCQDEQVTITKAQPTIGTTPSAGGTIGTIIHDVATVSGGYSPTGDVTFNLFAPGDTTCGSVIQTFANEPLSGLTATSGNYTTTAVGTYRWTATYNGDANNLTATSGCQDEKVTVGSAEQVAAAAAQQVLAAAVTLPKAGAGPQQQGSSAPGGGGPFGASGIVTTLLLALIGSVLFALRRRQSGEAEEPKA